MKGLFIKLNLKPLLLKFNQPPIGDSHEIHISTNILDRLYTDNIFFINSHTDKQKA